MQPPILPVSMPPLSSSSSFSSSSAAITTSSSSLPDLTAISISSPGTSTSMLLKGSEAQATRLLISSSFQDGIGSSEIRPFLPLPSGFADDGSTAIPAATSAGSHRKKRRHRVASDTSISSGSGGSDFDDHPHRDVRRAVVDICSKMFHYLGLGYKWFIRCIGLGCYSVLIMPGFLRVAYYYFFSSQVHRGIIYGDQPRNRLDLYLPKNANGPCPVVAFITGGAWIIGNKAWGSLLGMQLSESNIIVACIDYRNYPQGTISDMVKDASEGISFICNNISEYGGDPHRIYLMGQSAGAHIGACTLLEQAIKEAGEGESTSWSVSQVKAYFGLSGGYNLFDLLDHFHRRETYSPIFLSIMGGEQSLRRFSPELMVQDPSIRTAVSLLPEMILFHGTGDYTIPSVASKNFADTLRRVGVKAEAILYEGKTHTDLFVQDPMRGGRDEMFKDLVTAIHGDDSETLSNLMVAPPFKRLAPEFMLKMARWVSPF